MFPHTWYHLVLASRKADDFLPIDIWNAQGPEKLNWLGSYPSFSATPCASRDFTYRRRMERQTLPVVMGTPCDKAPDSVLGTDLGGGSGYLHNLNPCFWFSDMRTRSWPSLGVTWARHKSYATTSSCVTSSAPFFSALFLILHSLPRLATFFAQFLSIRYADGRLISPWLPDSLAPKQQYLVHRLSHQMPFLSQDTGMQQSSVFLHLWTLCDQGGGGWRNTTMQWDRVSAQSGAWVKAFTCLFKMEVFFFLLIKVTGSHCKNLF